MLLSDLRASLWGQIPTAKWGRPLIADYAAKANAPATTANLRRIASSL